MKHIKISFIDFWQGFDYKIMNFYRLLCERYDVSVTETPEESDYVFFSCFGDSHWEVPQSKIKIFFTAENITPDFNACDYAIAFDWMTYEGRYLRMSNIYSPHYSRKFIDIDVKREQLPVPEKTGFCSFVVSNSFADELRTQLFERLSQYKQVSSGGRYKNNVGGPIADKLEFERKHKFSICCENSSSPGYTTEKLYQAFAAQTVPIYWGDPEVCRVFNPKSFIFVNDYLSIDEVVERIKQLDNDDRAYMEILSEPVFLSPEKAAWDFQMQELKDFLYAIFDQDIEDAYRYNRHSAHFAYQTKMGEMLRKSKMTPNQLMTELLKSKLRGLVRRLKP